MNEVEIYFARENILWNISTWFTLILFFIVFGISVLAIFFEFVKNKIEQIKNKKKGKKI